MPSSPRIAGRPNRAKKLNQNLKYLQADYRALEARCDEQTRTLRQECTLRDQTEEALRLAEVIIAQSPVVLFRRMAGKKPTPVYVSSQHKPVWLFRRRPAERQDAVRADRAPGRPRPSW